MNQTNAGLDEQRRRSLQEYIFNLEEAADDAQDLAIAHEQLKESRDLLTAVLESTSHGMCLVRNHSFIWCNRAFTNILGWHQEELVGRDITVICADPRERAEIRAALDASRPGSRPVARTREFRHKCGRPVPCLVNICPRDERDGSRGYVLSVTDFSELTQAEKDLKTACEELERQTGELTRTNFELSREIKEHEETARKLNLYRNHLEDLVRQRTDELKETNEFLRREIEEREEQEEAIRKLEELESSILSAISHPVVGLKDRVVIFANDAVEEVFGWKPEELIGRSTRMFHATEAEYERIGGLYRILEKQKLYTDEVLCRHRDGRSMVCKFTASRIGTDLAHKQIVATYEDITERKRVEDALRENEQKYRNIFENTFEGIFQASPDGLVLSANPALAKLYGVDSPEDFIARVRNLSDLWADPGRGDEFGQLLRQYGALHHFEAEIRANGDEKKWVSINARSVVDSAGHSVYCEGTLQDISERKKLEHQLLQSQKMQAIGTLAGGIAHDINNILMGIQGYASLMLYDTDQTRTNLQRLSSVEDMVRSGAALTKQLLGFARGGKYEVRVINANEVIRKTAAMFGRTRKEIAIISDLDDGLLAVEADQGQIEQALVNLYLNAWQAMPEGGEIRLRTENAFFDEHRAGLWGISPGRFIKLSVADTGVGMDSRTRERIFEPFFTTKEMGHGTGLGLASVYGIIKNHGGVIDVASEKGRGSTFTIYLPATDKLVRPEKRGDAAVVKGKGRILVVDDEEIIAGVCASLLQALGYEAVIARGGREAVKIFQEERGAFDLVILDMVMPDMAGGETFERLKAADPEVRVVLASGYSMNSQTAAIMEQGCKAFMQKPFNLQQLSEAIRKVLD